MNKETVTDGIGFVEECWDRRWSSVGLSASPQGQERTRATLSLIPEDCSSILDVGCGDGKITNQLASQYKRVAGLDSSKEALKLVKTEKILGMMESLPFADRSFDLIICCEVLEHLPFKFFPKALNELERVAEKYIIISVPYKENLRKSMVRCPYCGCDFVPLRHVRSFDLNKSLSLFGNFTAQHYIFYHWYKDYSRLVFKIARLLGFLTRFPLNAVCPQCGYGTLPKDRAEIATSSRQDNSLVRVAGTWAKRLIPARRRPFILIVIYHRE